MYTIIAIVSIILREQKRIGFALMYVKLHLYGLRC